LNVLEQRPEKRWVFYQYRSERMIPLPPFIDKKSTLFQRADYKKIPRKTPDTGYNKTFQRAL
jgi:hypothetical protein